MDDFIDTWLHNILGICLLGSLGCFGMAIYSWGYGNGQQAGVCQVQQQLANPVSESPPSSSSPACCKKKGCCQKGDK